LAAQNPSLVKFIVFLAMVSTTATLVAYLACALAALWLQREGRMERSLTLVIACLLGFTYSAWAVYGVGWEPAASGFGLLGFGLLVYLVMRLGASGTAPADGKIGTVEG